MSGSLVADLGIGPEPWLFLSLLLCLTLFFKFSRIWSVRNLDLLLLFALAPGMMQLVGNRDAQPWLAFVWLFMGSMLWLLRSLLDLGLARRPLLEPNLNAAGLACLSVGVLGLLLVETVVLPIDEGSARNPADSQANAVEQDDPGMPDSNVYDAQVQELIRSSPLPESLKQDPRPRRVMARVLASLAHMVLVTALIAVGWKHFERPISGLAVATCYLITPYTRIALVDSTQVVPAALIVCAIWLYTRPALAAIPLGLAAVWMPACVGLLPLWTGFYRKRGALRFAAVGVGILGGSTLTGWMIPPLADWATGLGARSLTSAGLLPGIEAPPTGSFWAGIEDSYRLPVLIGYLALVILTSLWPAEKNLGELIALTAALLVASQFWYLDEGGTLVVLYLPIVLLMMFRPNLVAKRPPVRTRSRPAVQKSLFLVP